jgi:hypothetical protein
MISKCNAALITNVKLDGIFMTAPEFRTDRPPPLEFTRLLRVWTATLSLGCPALRKLTLSQEPVFNRWEDYLNRELATRAFLDRVKGTVEELADELPGLHELRLGHSRILHWDERLWGDSLRWMDIVRERNVEQKGRFVE